MSKDVQDDDELDWGDQDNEDTWNYDQMPAGQNTMDVDDGVDVVSLGGGEDDTEFPNYPPHQEIEENTTIQSNGTSNQSNSASGTTQPLSRSSTELSKSLHPGLPQKPVTSWDTQFVSPSDPSFTAASAMSITRKDSNGLLPDWEPRTSRQGGDTYYYNVKTHETTWTKPAATDSSGTTNPSSSPIIKRDKKRASPPVSTLPNPGNLPPRPQPYNPSRHRIERSPSPTIQGRHRSLSPARGDGRRDRGRDRRPAHRPSEKREARRDLTPPLLGDIYRPRYSPEPMVSGRVRSPPRGQLPPVRRRPERFPDRGSPPRNHDAFDRREHDYASKITEASYPNRRRSLSPRRGDRRGPRPPRGSPDIHHSRQLSPDHHFVPQKRGMDFPSEANGDRRRGDLPPRPIPEDENVAINIKRRRLNGYDDSRPPDVSHHWGTRSGREYPPEASVLGTHEPSHNGHTTSDRYGLTAERPAPLSDAGFSTSPAQRGEFVLPPTSSEVAAAYSRRNTSRNGTGYSEEGARHARDDGHLGARLPPSGPQAGQRGSRYGPPEMVLPRSLQEADDHRRPHQRVRNRDRRGPGAETRRDRSPPKALAEDGGPYKDRMSGTPHDHAYANRPRPPLTPTDGGRTLPGRGYSEHAAPRLIEVDNVGAVHPSRLQILTGLSPAEIEPASPLYEDRQARWETTAPGPSRRWGAAQEDRAVQNSDYGSYPISQGPARPNSPHPHHDGLPEGGSRAVSAAGEFSEAYPSRDRRYSQSSRVEDLARRPPQGPNRSPPAYDYNRPDLAPPNSYDDRRSPRSAGTPGGYPRGFAGRDADRAHWDPSADSGYDRSGYDSQRQPFVGQSVGDPGARAFGRPSPRLQAASALGDELRSPHLSRAMDVQRDPGPAPYGRGRSSSGLDAPHLPPYDAPLVVSSYGYHSTDSGHAPSDPMALDPPPSADRDHAFRLVRPPTSAYPEAAMQRPHTQLDHNDLQDDDGGQRGSLLDRLSANGGNQRRRGAGPPIRGGSLQMRMAPAEPQKSNESGGPRRGKRAKRGRGPRGER